MTIAVNPNNIDRFLELSRKHDVESTVIGRYESDGKLHITYQGKTCAYLDLSLFTQDFPQWEFDAHWRSPQARGLVEPVLSEPANYGEILHAVLASPNVCSREWIQRQYDHEVQGGSAIKYLIGRERDIPNDSVVVRPILESNRGLAVAQTLNPSYSIIDTYDMVAASIDEAVRRLLSVGAKLDEIGGVDNFCWPSIQFDPVQNPDGRYKAAQLVRANWALRDMCVAYGIPLLSGKDSMYVDGHLAGEFGERHKISGLPTMQFTATGVVPDINGALTMESKTAGDLVYILGETGNELGASEYYEFLGYVGLNVPKVDVRVNLTVYQALQTAIRAGSVASCHGIYRGGLAVHAALMAMGGLLGMTLDLSKVPLKNISSHGQATGTSLLRDDQILFSESCGRFLVTIPMDKRNDFEACFQNLPCACIGEITAEPQFLIKGRDESTLSCEAIARLKSSWRRMPAA